MEQLRMPPGLDVRAVLLICCGGVFWRGALPLKHGVLRCSAFCRCFAVFGARPCAAGACWRSLVAASGGQGGIGGLRVPPTPSLDSLLTPLYRRRSAMGLEAAERRVLARRSAAGARGGCAALRLAVDIRQGGGLAGAHGGAIQRGAAGRAPRFGGVRHAAPVLCGLCCPGRGG